MCNLCNEEHHEMPRRDFIKTVSVSVAGVSLGAGKIMNDQGIVKPPRNQKRQPVIFGCSVESFELSDAG